jgi:hypothetical protein
MAIAVPPWVIKTIDTLIRGILWCGTEVASGGKCVVVWVRVAWPTVYGGLGIPNLHLLGFALHMRWLWLAQADPTRTWTTFHLPSYLPANDFFKPGFQALSEMARGPFSGRIIGSTVPPSKHSCPISGQWCRREYETITHGQWGPHVKKVGPRY